MLAQRVMLVIYFSKVLRSQFPFCFGEIDSRLDIDLYFSSICLSMVIILRALLANLILYALKQVENLDVENFS